VRRIALAALYVLLSISRPISGIGAFQVRALHPHRPCDVAVDGEVMTSATFDVVGEALRIITPLEFRAIDD